MQQKARNSFTPKNNSRILYSKLGQVPTLPISVCPYTETHHHIVVVPKHVISFI